MMKLLDLPDCMLEQVLEHLSYDEIARNRVVCQKFNRTCQGLLNIGFQKMNRRHAYLLKMIKCQLPRRESERRSHPLAKHSDILTCIETRISMLSMTYMKYIETNLCCFIPGKVIDEIIHVFGTISHPKVKNASSIFILSERPLRTHEVLQELRDISSMAIDHFEEKIAPSLKKAYCELPSRSLLTYAPDVSMSTPCLAIPSIYSQMQYSSTPQPKQTISRPLDTYQTNFVWMERKLKTAMRKLNNVIGIQNRQAQKLRSCTMQINELNAQVIDLRRRLEESTNAKKALEQLSGPAITVSDRQTRSSMRNIKARTATIILKRLAEKPETNTQITKKSKIH